MPAGNLSTTIFAIGLIGFLGVGTLGTFIGGSAPADSRQAQSQTGALRSDSLTLSMTIERDGVLYAHIDESIVNEGQHKLSTLMYALPRYSTPLFLRYQETLPKEELSYTEVRSSGVNTDLALTTRIEQTGDESLIVIAPSKPASALPDGALQFSTQMKVHGRVLHFSSHDELVWPVSGYRNMFSRSKFNARIDLPPFVEPTSVSVAAFTRVRGESGSVSNKIDKVRFKVELDDRTGRAFVRCWLAKPLSPLEMYFIQLRWPKGFVKEPA